MLKKTSWRPILTGEAKARALAAVGEIVAAVPDPSSDSQNASLSGGSAGLAILCGYLARAGLDDDENAAQFLTHALNSVSSRPMGPSLFGGFTGIAWAAAHLEEQLLDPEDDLNEVFDEALGDYLNQSPWKDHYDLVSGLVGLGIYGIERLPSAAAVNYLERVVQRLEETAERSADSVTWLTRPDLLPEWQRALCPNGYYNLGLSHGIPGVIALLGQVCAAGIVVEKARPLLDGAVTWLLRQRRASAAACCFPAWVAPDVEPDDCRLAWCYGDAGVAAALLLAARCVNEVDWEREAIEIARRAAKRDPKNAGVRDGGLCHGSAGLGHIFNRLFQASGEKVFAHAARFWFGRTLEFSRKGSGVGGFSSHRVDMETGAESWESEIGILEGAAGIALVLLAAVNDIEPEWDRVLLLSARQNDC